MSKSTKKLINLNKNEFIDRRIEENINFSEFNIQLSDIDTVLLLLDSQEEMVLLNVLKHLMEYVRRNEDNIKLLKEKNLLELLLKKDFYRQQTNILIKRSSLYLASFIMESMNCLMELESMKTKEILYLVVYYYQEEDDDFCCEYLSVIINKCLEDPQMVEMILSETKFMLKYFSIFTTSNNPDVLLHSLEIMYKILKVQNEEDKIHFLNLETFPLNRLLCELNCEFFEIRKVDLKVLKLLVMNYDKENPLLEVSKATILLQQLSKMFVEILLTEELNLVLEVLASTMEQESMITLFFELNLFDKVLQKINDDNLEFNTICKSLMVFTECAQSVRFLQRLVAADLIEIFLKCLLNEAEKPVAAHILLGLNRLMKSPEASKRIIEFYDQGLLTRILKILSHKDFDIKTREQSANLIQNLLSYNFHKTATEILDLNFAQKLSDIFSQDPEERSIDLLLALINIIEVLAANINYRKKICENRQMVKNLGILLMKSFSTAILVISIFRCLCSIIDEYSAQQELLNCYLCSSIKRALQSLANQIKIAVTNFIIQTTRFPTFVTLYIDCGVLEILLLHQKHAFCIPTWPIAIDSILDKNPTLKFCIRNSLGFTDITKDVDFKVSKRKFEDFRIFQCILKEEVSPLHPIIVVNFNRPKIPEDSVVKVPVPGSEEEKFKTTNGEWCYCRFPADEFLPKYLEEVNNLLELQDLAVNPLKLTRNVDFQNLAQKAKIIAQVVAHVLGNDLKTLDLNTREECSQQTVNCHLKDLCIQLHCSLIPLGLIRSGCQFERAILFKALADQVGLPCTLQRSVDGRMLFNELPLPAVVDHHEEHCDRKSMEFMPWRLLRPTHIVDLMFNVGELYPLLSRQALQYLRLY